MTANILKLKLMPRTKHLGWSYSRNNVFELCKRRYYYEYYGGRDLDNAPKIFWLKDLTSVPLEIGNITHLTIEKILAEYRKSPGSIDTERILIYVQRQGERTRETKTFADIYYKQRENVDIENEIVQPVLSSIMNFMKSPRHEWIRGQALATADDWIVELKEPYVYGECLMGRWKAFAKVDAMFPVGHEFHIFDWKTGESGKYSQFDIQMKAYASWAKYHLDAPISKIRTYIVLLQPEFSERPLQFNEADMESFLQLVEKQTEAMYDYCVEPDFNMPKPKDAFPMTPHVKLCQHCNFRELCDRA